MLRLLGWLLACMFVTSRVHAKWVEGRIDTKENWAFLSRFCFLSFEGQFEYLIEYDKEMGIPNLLLYYDDSSQWPSVYHSSKSCKEREEVLNRGQNQVIRLSHWYPDTEYSGCKVTMANRELPISKSTQSPNSQASTEKPKNKNSTKPISPESSYYDQFFKTTSKDLQPPESNITATTWYELLPTDDLNITTTMTPEDELWESISPGTNISHFEKLKDVEILFDNRNTSGHKIKRSLYEYDRRRYLNSDSKKAASSTEKEKLVVSCHNTRRFRSARERWWFIAISNCDNNKGLDVRYKFLMTNGADGDFWHEHFSADEFYVLPVLLAYTFAYVIVMIAVVMCSVELKSRHLLHSTYKLFLGSIVAQQSGVTIHALSYVRYAANGFGGENAKIVGQFMCGLSEMTFLLLLVLMAKGYTITRGRLKVAFTIKLTVFMCCYLVTYIILFVYQAKAFDPGEVLYLYESPAGYGLIVLRMMAWCVFAYSSFFTVKKYPEKNTFYCPFFICGTLWFNAGPLFILTANSYIDKWVRESVVIAVLLFITFCGHIMFLVALLTLPVFANKNFPYHVRTTQIGIMEVTGNRALDGFGPNAYHPSHSAPQTVIIPLTRRTEELIGNMYNQYVASAPPLSLEDQISKLNGVTKRIESTSPKHQLIQQESTETNSSDDIKPTIKEGSSKEIFTVENEISKLEHPILPDSNIKTVMVENKLVENLNERDLPLVSRSRRNLLEPIKREDNVPSWSLAKGPCIVGVIKKTKSIEEESSETLLQNGRKVPSVRNGLQPSSGEISTIHEGRIQSYQNGVSKATLDLFSVGSNKG